MIAIALSFLFEFDFLWSREVGFFVDLEQIYFVSHGLNRQDIKRNDFFF